MIPTRVKVRIALCAFAPILPPLDGYLFLKRAKFPASFAGDVDKEKTVFMADSQVPWGVDALGGTISERPGRPDRVGTWLPPTTR